MKLLQAVFLICGVPAAAQVPAMYEHVDRMFWVVDEPAAAIAGWRTVGAVDGPTLNNEDSHWVTVPFSGIVIDFVKAVPKNPRAFSDFRKRHGQGIMALVHHAPTLEALDAQVTLMKSRGVSVLNTGVLPNEAGSKYVLFDTEPQGKYVLGIAYVQASSASRTSVRKISQYAFVARDLGSVSDYWAKLGFPKMSFTHPQLWDLKYHDKPGEFDALLGWQRHGNVVYEWIQPLIGPTTYLDHMQKNGEGVHHIAFQVANIEGESAEWVRKGFPFQQSGAWGERDKPGHGRFVYQDAHKIGGIDIELLWNYR
jgi:methylmalonyl-CoA/ethylmalonyl-CoA epimerase